MTNEELENSPLFEFDDDQSIFETHQDVITVPNLDQAGNANWILTINPDAPDLDQSWRDSPGRIQAITGRRPDLMGTYNTPERPEMLYVTDDIRVWIMLRATGCASLYTTTIRDRIGDSVL